MKNILNESNIMKRDSLHKEWMEDSSRNEYEVDGEEEEEDDRDGYTGVDDSNPDMEGLATFHLFLWRGRRPAASEQPARLLFYSSLHTFTREKTK